jgi:hypothetical protein
LKKRQPRRNEYFATNAPRSQKRGVFSYDSAFFSAKVSRGVRGLAPRLWFGIGKTHIAFRRNQAFTCRDEAASAQHNAFAPSGEIN